MKSMKLLAVALGSLLLVPAVAVAQSSIAGLVIDTTGGVLPGVTVEAARGGPRFSDRLLRWSPDPTGGIWNATQETELPG